MIVDLDNALSQFDTHWHPHLVASLNGQHVKVAKSLDTFDWHHHEHEDELFLVLHGALTIRFRDREDVHLTAGQLLVVPRGVDHQPHAEAECSVLLFEPASTLNTGNVESAHTVRDVPQLS